MSPSAGTRPRGPADRGAHRGGCSLACRRKRLPGDALIKRDVGLGLAEEVPVGHRPEIIVSGGRSARGGDRRRAWRLTESHENPLDGRGIGDKSDDASAIRTVVAAILVQCSNVSFGSGTAYRRRGEVSGLESDRTRGEATRAASAFWTLSGISASTADSFGDIGGILDRLEHPVDDLAVVMEVAVEGGTEAMDEAHRAEARVRAGAAALAQIGRDGAQQDVQHGADRPRLALQEKRRCVTAEVWNRPWCRSPVRTSCPAVRSAAIVHGTIGRSSPHWRTGNGGKT